MPNKLLMQNRAFSILENYGSSVAILPKVRHYLGFPKAVKEDGEDSTLLPSAEVVLIVSRPQDHGAFVYRLTREGEEVGETWHEKLEDAYHQVEYEYGGRLGRWESIPEHVKDPIQHVLDSLSTPSEPVQVVVTEPVFVIEGRDVSLFRTISDAERGLEAQDVSQGLFRLFDSHGRELTLTVEFGSVRVMPEPGANNASYLRDSLEFFFRFCGFQVREGVPLAELVDLARREMKPS